MTEPFDAKEAADHCLKPVARYNELRTGEEFRFPGTQHLFVKVKSGYRRKNGVHGTFSTGGKTAVIPIP